MTDQELDAIEERVNAATPGPWEVHRVSWSKERIGMIATPPVRGEYPPDNAHGDWESSNWSGDGRQADWVQRIVQTDSGCYPPRLPDAEFIAHARSDVPALLAEIRRLRAAR